MSVVWLVVEDAAHGGVGRIWAFDIIETWSVEFDDDHGLDDGALGQELMAEILEESDREFVEFTIIDNRDVKGRNG